MRAYRAVLFGPVLAAAGSGGTVHDAYWRPAGGPVDRGASVLPIRVDEQACSSGDSESIPDRIDGVTVRERGDAIVISVTVRAKGGDQSCEGAPPSPPIDVDLPSPIGDRAVIDGAREKVKRATDAVRIPGVG